MAQSFTIDPGAFGTHDLGAVRRRVAVTGAAGHIGSFFAQHAKDKYDLRLTVLPGEDTSEIEDCGEVVPVALSDLDALKAAFSGMDTVLHLAGSAGPSTEWSEILENNIIGTYHAFVAAKSAGCRRLIYASSIHAVSGYPRDVQVKTTEPVNPGDLYGVSKCFGEALGRYIAEQERMSVIALRIGAFQPLDTVRQDDGMVLLDAFVSQRDLQQLIERCINDEHLRFAIFHGLSDNGFKRLDISDAREMVGYVPIDDAASELPKLASLHLSETINAHNLTDAAQESGIRAEAY